MKTIRNSKDLTEIREYMKANSDEAYYVAFEILCVCPIKLKQLFSLKVRHFTTTLHGTEVEPHWALICDDPKLAYVLPYRIGLLTDNYVKKHKLNTDSNLFVSKHGNAILDNAFSRALSKTASALNVSDLNTLELRKMARDGFPESENFLMLSFGEDFYGIYGYCFEKSPELQSMLSSLKQVKESLESFDKNYMKYKESLSVDQAANMLLQAMDCLDFHKFWYEIYMQGLEMNNNKSNK